MYTAIIIFIILICALLVTVVLLQNSKGGGITAGFTGANQVMGVKRTSDLLEQLTWGFAIALMALTLSTTIVMGSRSESSGPKSVNIERASGKSAGGPNPAVTTPSEKAMQSPDTTSKQ